MHAAAGGDEGVHACGGDLGGDGVLFGFAQNLVGGVGGFAAVGVGLLAL